MQCLLLLHPASWWHHAETVFGACQPLIESWKAMLNHISISPNCSRHVQSIVKFVGVGSGGRNAWMSMVDVSPLETPFKWMG